MKAYMMKQKPLKLTGLIAMASVLVACGKKPAEANYEQRPAVPGFHEDSAQGDASVGSGNQPIAACTYWDSLASVQKSGFSGSFQFLENFEVSASGIRGRFNLLRLPQARFGFSQEFNAAQPGKHFLPSVWTFDNFYAFAIKTIADAKAVLEKKLAESNNEAEKAELKKQIAALDEKKSKLDTAKKYPWLRAPQTNWRRADAVALDGRNENLVAKVEESMPGAFTGNAGPLNNAPFFKGLVASMGGLDAALLASQTNRLTKRVSLFVSDDWSARRLDLQKSLASLTTENEGNPTPITPQEKLCRHLVAQRLMAQILTLKGMEGAPQVTAQGTLPPLPTAWNEEFKPFSNLAGTGYAGVVVGEAWIMDQMKKEPSRMARMVGAESTEQHLEATRFWMSLISHRLATTWQTGKDPVADKLNLSPALLKLGFGLFGIHMNIVKAVEMHIFPENERATNGYIELRENEPDNLARLILFVRETLVGLRGLRSENDFAHKLLSPEQIAAFTARGTGLLDLFGDLRKAALLEGYIRMNQGRGSDTLADVLEQTK